MQRTGVQRKKGKIKINAFKESDELKKDYIHTPHYIYIYKTASNYMNQHLLMLVHSKPDKIQT